MIHTIPGLATGLLSLAAFGIVLSALLVRAMIRLAVMDMPVDRSAHERPTPRGGGVGAVAAVLAGVPAGLALLTGPHSSLLPAPLLPALLPVLLLLGGVLLLAAVSWLDDLRQLPPVVKLAAQCVSSLAITASAALQPGDGIRAALEPVLPAGWSFLAMPLFSTVGVCWLLFCTNAVNFTDGLNGLAAGVTALCALAMVAVGLAEADMLLCLVALMLAAGLAGFLPFNFPRASIFMGDVGSQTCGILSGWFALELLSHTGRPALAVSVPLILAALLADVLFTLGRRLLARERLTQAHRGHLYQVATRAGVDRTVVTLIEWGLAIWGIAAATLFLPDHPCRAVIAVLLPLGWCGWRVRQRARRAGLQRWS